MTALLDQPTDGVGGLKARYVNGIYTVTNRFHETVYTIDPTTRAVVFNNTVNPNFVQEDVTGSYPPASVGEWLLKNTLAGAGVLAIRNESPTGFSAFMARTAGGNEVFALGYGNTGLGALFNDKNYIQSWSGVSSAADPKELFISMDGNYGPSGSGVRFYKRQNFLPNGDIKFWKLIPWGTTQEELLHLDAVNNLIKMPVPIVNTPQTITDTGTVNALGPLLSSWVRVNNASAITINGIAGGVDGKEHEFSLVNSTGGANATINHENGSASAADRISIPDGLAKTVNFRGNFRVRYDGTSGRWRYMAQMTS